MDENIIQRCIDPYYYSGYSGYSGYSDYSPPPHREAAITETNYINLLNELKRESSENCPAVNFANDEKNVPTYEKLCSRSSDPKEKEEARKFRRKALIKLHPDKNSKCAKGANEKANAITQILNECAEKEK